MMGFDMKNLKKVQNKIYRTVSDYCGKMHSDSIADSKYSFVSEKTLIKTLTNELCILSKIKK